MALTAGFVALVLASPAVAATRQPTRLVGPFGHSTATAIQGTIDRAPADA